METMLEVDWKKPYRHLATLYHALIITAGLIVILLYRPFWSQYTAPAQLERLLLPVLLYASLDMIRIPLPNGSSVPLGFPVLLTVLVRSVNPAGVIPIAIAGALLSEWMYSVFYTLLTLKQNWISALSQATIRAALYASHHAVSGSAASIAFLSLSPSLDSSPENLLAVVAYVLVYAAVSMTILWPHDWLVGHLLTAEERRLPRVEIISAALVMTPIPIVLNYLYGLTEGPSRLILYFVALSFLALLLLSRSFTKTRVLYRQLRTRESTRSQIGSPTNLEELTHSALDCASDLVEYQCGAMYSYEDDGESFRLRGQKRADGSLEVYRSGMPNQSHSLTEPSSVEWPSDVRLGDRCIGAVIQQGNPLVIFQRATLALETYRLPPNTALMILPVSARGQVIGLLALARPNKLFTLTERDEAKTLTDALGNILHAIQVLDSKLEVIFNEIQQYLRDPTEVQQALDELVRLNVDVTGLMASISEKALQLNLRAVLQSVVTGQHDREPLALPVHVLRETYQEVQVRTEDMPPWSPKISEILQTLTSSLSLAFAFRYQWPEIARGAEYVTLYNVLLEALDTKAVSDIVAQGPSIEHTVADLGDSSPAFRGEICGQLERLRGIVDLLQETQRADSGARAYLLSNALKLLHAAEESAQVELEYPERFIILEVIGNWRLVVTSELYAVQREEPLISRKLGPLRIVEEIGSGATATVYKARQPSLDRPVAVKVLSYDNKQEEFLSRFKRKAQAIAKLRHPNILSVHDFGVEGNLAYIVMDYVSGGTLVDSIRHGLLLETAIEIAIQIGNALHHAHEQGILHRNLKPSNILIDTDGIPLLTDFSLTKTSPAAEPLTQRGISAGWAFYVAPEQSSDEESDTRSDVYALGVVLYEMVTGRLPFEAEDSTAVMLKKLQESAPPCRRFNPSLPVVLEQVILKAIAPLPEDRYQSALELVEALRSVLDRVWGEVPPEEEDEWQQGKHLIEDTLFTTGTVSLEQLVGIAKPNRQFVWSRYFYRQQSEYNLVVETSRAWIKNQDELDAFNQIWQEMACLISDENQPMHESEFDQCAAEVTRQFQASIERAESLPSVLPSESPFLAFSLDTRSAFEGIRLPSSVPLLFFRRPILREEDAEILRRLLQVRIRPPRNLAFLVIPGGVVSQEHAEDILQTRLSAYACDVVLLGLAELNRVSMALKPQVALRRLVISKVDLLRASPFVITGPAPQNMFFGRERELREISDNASTASYAVIGGRRIGKSSLLIRLHSARLPAAGFRTLYYDCSTTSSFHDLRVASIHEWRPQPPAEDLATFGDLLDSPPTDRTLVILLDEADKLVPGDRAADWPLFNALRALANSGYAQFVLSGERTLRDALHDPTGPLFNFANEILLGPLDFQSVAELVTRPLKQLGIELFNEKTIVQCIYDSTSGHPNVVQRLCYRLVERLSEQSSRGITLEDVNAVLEDPRFQEIDFLQTYWEAASPLERIITLVISQEARSYRLKDVRRLLSEQVRIQPSMTAIKEALDRLVDLRSILKRSQAGYALDVEAFPRVLANITTLEDLLEVLAEQYEQTEGQG